MKSFKMRDKKVIQIGNSLGVIIDNNNALKHNVKKGDIIDEVIITRKED